MPAFHYIKWNLKAFYQQQQQPPSEYFLNTLFEHIFRKKNKFLPHLKSGAQRVAMKKNFHIIAVKSAGFVKVINLSLYTAVNVHTKQKAFLAGGEREENAVKCFLKRQKLFRLKHSHVI